MVTIKSGGSIAIGEEIETDDIIFTGDVSTFEEGYWSLITRVQTFGNVIVFMLDRYTAMDENGNKLSTLDETVYSVRRHSPSLGVVLKRYGYLARYYLGNGTEVDVMNAVYWDGDWDKGPIINIGGSQFMGFAEFIETATVTFSRLVITRSLDTGESIGIRTRWKADIHP